MNDSRQSDGIGFLGGLALLFIGLKLGGVIHWPWIWVLAPLWISYGIALFILVALGIIAILNK
ncbi:MAG: hypothetical protein ACO236_04340 [Candidatus Nanopelagicaceae bacterium]